VGGGGFELGRDDPADREGSSHGGRVKRKR
jgi:hypothetical protein